jgi:predicted RNase H-like HicB family nuclease
MLTVQTMKFFTEEDGTWLGYLQDYPAHWTQGETLDDLKDHLRDLY